MTTSTKRTEVPRLVDLPPGFTFEAVSVEAIVPDNSVWVHQFDLGWVWHTVSAHEIKRGGFHGTTVCGDSYQSGTRPVYRLRYVNPCSRVGYLDNSREEG